MSCQPPTRTGARTPSPPGSAGPAPDTASRSGPALRLRAAAGKPPHARRTFSPGGAAARRGTAPGARGGRVNPYRGVRHRERHSPVRRQSSAGPAPSVRLPGPRCAPSGAAPSRRSPACNTAATEEGPRWLPLGSRPELQPPAGRRQWRAPQCAGPNGAGGPRRWARRGRERGGVLAGGAAAAPAPGSRPWLRWRRAGAGAAALQGLSAAPGLRAGRAFCPAAGEAGRAGQRERHTASLGRRLRGTEPCPGRRGRPEGGGGPARKARYELNGASEELRGSLRGVLPHIPVLCHGRIISLEIHDRELPQSLQTLK